MFALGWAQSVVKLGNQLGNLPFEVTHSPYRDTLSTRSTAFEIQFNGLSVGLDEFRITNINN